MRWRKWTRKLLLGNARSPQMESGFRLFWGSKRICKNRGAANSPSIHSQYYLSTYISSSVHDTNGPKLSILFHTHTFCNWICFLFYIVPCRDNFSHDGHGYLFRRTSANFEANGSVQAIQL